MTPRRYSRYDAIHLVSTTLASFQVELQRNELRRRYPETNFGYRVRSRSRNHAQATTELNEARARLIEKLKSLPGVVEISPKEKEVVFKGTNCNYLLTVDMDQTDWDGTPILDIGIYSGGSYRF